MGFHLPVFDHLHRRVGRQWVGLLRRVAEPEHEDRDQRVHREPGSGRLHGHLGVSAAHADPGRDRDLVPGNCLLQGRHIFAGNQQLCE